MASLERAKITNVDTGDEIEAFFNPEEYSLSKDINYAQTGVPGLSAPILQFVHGNLQTLEMELFLDTYEEHKTASRTQNEAREDVRKLTRRVTQLMDINPETHAPPVLLFAWGSLSFTCVLARVNQRFIMFLPDGIPVRARLQVTFNEFRNVDLEAKEIKRETSDFSEVRVALEGETLADVAEKSYGDPTLWRPIGLVNDVDDPRELMAGASLLVPRLPYRDPKTGEVHQ